MPFNPRIAHWQGRRAWLVGASSGIGRATASALHARGAQVIVSARRGSELHAFARQHPGSQTLVLDTTDRAAVQDASEKLLASGPIDLVCYCAGTFEPLRATASTWT